MQAACATLDLTAAEGSQPGAIRRAYLDLARELHPDRNAAPDATVRLFGLVCLTLALRSD